MKNLKKLKWLDFSLPGGKEEATDKNPSASYDYIIGIVSELTDLEYLDLCNWRFGVYDDLGKLTKLKTFIGNYNYINDLSPFLSCPDLEELHVAHNRMYWGHNKGAACLLNDDGTLKLGHLRKLDMWSQEERTGYPN